MAVFPPARCLGPLRACSGRGGRPMAEEPINVSCFGVQCCSNILSGQGQPTPPLGTNWWELSPKGQWKEEEDTLYSSTPTSITGKAKAMEMTGLRGRRGGTLTGMAVANTAEARSHYDTATSWHTQLGAVRKVYLTVLGCSKDGLCLCLKVKRRKETRETLGQI